MYRIYTGDPGTVFADPGPDTDLKRVIVRMREEQPERGGNFIEQIIREDLVSGKVSKVMTRFPPEPNGYLHIGHAKSICLNFGLAEQFDGECNLRFDDTNPSKEETEYVESIMEDVAWLGFRWANLCFASDYFDQFHEWALELIRAGKAYVDHQTAEEIRKTRGTLKEPGVGSPYRDRPVEENLELFRKMKEGHFAEGECVLRARIDMAHPNLNMRDPVMYRILHQSHHRTGDKWCVYPMYDFAHGYEDAIEGITHSICTLEFEDHRPLYDWFLDNVSIPSRPRQYEFARLNLTYTVMSKRKLLELVSKQFVSGWDDPRMPTISGLRRRGYTPSSIRSFCKKIGVSRANSLVDVELLHHCIRDELNASAPRAMAVLKPLKLVIENYPEGPGEEIEVVVNPESETPSFRKVPFSRELYIERDDFMEDPPKKYFRLSPGAEVRLKHAYIVKCKGFEKGSDGSVVEVRCEYDPRSRGGEAPDGRRIRGTLHWVSASHAVKAEVRLYDHLFTLRDMDDMEEGTDYKDHLNPRSLEIITGCMVEPYLAKAAPMDRFQFLRQGYFIADPDHTGEKPLFNRTVPLKDSWAKEMSKDPR
ncbi:MAG: glutamine--tRNA ligase/YqeY domain fusion protein [Thermovirgaceae bacterium]|nr:glutamine--tRNA ligase/YqeY domain fusion protein [Synergistales bacterium]HRW87059.1 glutamine--tRNA ligase/YqeY domain fusion protein [Thermovirgaceae bacterium]MDD3133141.1 glutamine--tRNA ligase/YqeY domain fusion protein [Synergistales bacterium]MDD3829619.1 glutamine--tRNA ligase/YqeY domain fusion protein [Synergistales bacterium]MDD4023075.1 glutamine--tRNA ligase/YqeY domain fusion protein [Synergistales bacterium]